MTEPTNQPIDQSTSRRRPRIGTLVAALLLVVGVGSLGLTPIRTDHDVFWHLKTGQLIIDNGFQLPPTDPFTYGSEGVAWHNHEWLAQICMAGLYRLGTGALRVSGMEHAMDQAGLRMLVLAKTLVLLAVFGVVARTLVVNGVCPILACAIALLCAMASRWSIHCRPPVITLLFLAVQLTVLGRHWHRRHPWTASLAALFHFALWSNFHGGWLAGLVVLGCWVAGDLWWLISHLRGGRKFRVMVDDRRLRAHLLMFVAGFLGVLLNPSGWHLYELTIRVMSAKDLVALIPEMMPPPLIPHWPFYLMLIFAGAALIAGLIRRGLVRPGEGFALLFFAWQATSHARHVPLFVIVAALPVGRMLQAYVGWWEKRLPGRAIAGVMLLKQLVLVLFILFAIGKPLIIRGMPAWEPQLPRNREWFAGLGYEPWRYQDAACDFILLADLPDRVWTNLNIGGFMIWRLSPETHRVYTDSRFDVHGDSRQQMEMSINGVGPNGGVPDPNWEQVLSDLGVNFAVLEKATPLVMAMWQSPNWQAVHEWTAPGGRWRDGTIVFVRDTPENADAIARARRIAQSMGQVPVPILR